MLLLGELSDPPRRLVRCNVFSSPRGEKTLHPGGRRLNPIGCNVFSPLGGDKTLHPGWGDWAGWRCWGWLGRGWWGWGEWGDRYFALGHGESVPGRGARVVRGVCRVARGFVVGCALALAGARPGCSGAALGL